MNDFLKDIKVLELAGVLAGPAVGTFLAELGADVTKIESPQGDVTRSWKTKKENPENSVSAYFSSVNLHKKYIRLDLKNETDKNNFDQLLINTDILITNFKKGDDEKLKVDYETLKKIKPDLIYASINGYGEDSERTAFDAVLQAETGFMSMNGTVESGPLKMPVALIDVLAAHQLKEGILVALIHKLKTGNGAHVSVSLFDTAISSLMNQASNFLMNGEIAKLQGSLHPNIAPYGETFETSNHQYLLLAVGSDKQFHQLCKELDLEKTAYDEKFNSNQNRIKFRKELALILAAKLKTRNGDYWNQKLTAAKIPNGLVKNIKEVFESENAKTLIETETIEGVITKRVKNSIFKIHFE